MRTDDCGDGDVEQLEQQLRNLTAIDEGGAVAPLEPHLPGEFFVLERLLALSRDRTLAQGQALKHCAWSRGKDPRAFAVRLANDALKRTQQIAVVCESESERVTTVVDAVLNSGLRRENYPFGRRPSAAFIAVTASRSARRNLVDDIIAGLKAVKEEFRERAATDLATCYFGQPSVAPDPARREAVATAIRLIRGEHDTPEIANLEAVLRQ